MPPGSLPVTLPVTLPATLPLTLPTTFPSVPLSTPTPRPPLHLHALPLPAGAVRHGDGEDAAGWDPGPSTGLAIYDI